MVTWTFKQLKNKRSTIKSAHMIHFRCSCTHFRLFLTQMIYRIVSEVSQYKVAFKNLGSVFEKKSHAFV